MQTPRSDDPVSGNRLQECLQNFVSLEKEIQFTQICEVASFLEGVSFGMCCKTVADVDDGSGDRTPACREYTHPRADSGSRIYAAIPERTLVGPVLQTHIVRFLGTHGTEISNSIHDNVRSKFLGSQKPRKDSLRG